MEKQLLTLLDEAIEASKDKMLEIEKGDDTKLRLLATKDGYFYAAYIYKGVILYRTTSTNAYEVSLNMNHFIQNYEQLITTKSQYPIPNEALSGVIKVGDSGQVTKTKMDELEYICSKLGPYKHYTYAKQTLGVHAAYEWLQQRQKILAQSERLPHNMRLIVENGELYLSFGETSLTPETLDEYMTKYDLNVEDLSQFVNGTIQGFKCQWQASIDKLIDKDIVAFIVAERLRQNMTQEDLAEKAHIDITFLQHIESRRQTMSLRVLNKLMKALGRELKLI